MTGGFTSVPLPAYWSSKDPEQWRKYPLKTLACGNLRCAANNANYATICNENPSKRPRRPYKVSSRSRSISATSIPSTPRESERNSKSEYAARCSDCNAPLVPSAQPGSSSTTLTPPTPLQERTVVPGSHVPRLNTSHSYVTPRIRESPPYFHNRRKTRNPGLSAPPPSECGDYSSEETGSSVGKVVGLSNHFGEEEHVKDPVPEHDQTSTGVFGTEPEPRDSPHPARKEISHETSRVEEVETTGSITSICGNENWNEVQGTGRESLVPAKLEDGNGLRPPFQGSDGGDSGSTVSPTPSESGLNLSYDVRSACDRSRICSFYNALYTPDANLYDEQEEYLDIRRGGAEYDLKLKVALEIAVLSAFVTILILACFPSFLSGVRYHVLGCCSCTHQTAAIAGTLNPSPQFGELKWFHRWVYPGSHSFLGCRSPKQTVGSTVLR